MDVREPTLVDATVRDGTFHLVLPILFTQTAHAIRKAFLSTN